MKNAHYAAIQQLQRSIDQGQKALEVIEAAGIHAEIRQVARLRLQFLRLRRIAARGFETGARWEKELRELGIDASLSPPSRIGARVRRLCGR